MWLLVLAVVALIGSWVWWNAPSSAPSVPPVDASAVANLELLLQAKNGCGAVGVINNAQGQRQVVWRGDLFRQSAAEIRCKIAPHPSATSNQTVQLMFADPSSGGWKPVGSQNGALVLVEPGQGLAFTVGPAPDGTVTPRGFTLDLMLDGLGDQPNCGAGKTKVGENQRVIFGYPVTKGGSTLFHARLGA